MATNNVNNKVTFWNNVSFTPEDVKNNFILNDKPGLDNKGIYFNSNNNYPHIIYNGYIYTTGSYISTYTMVSSTTIINAITSIAADPFTKAISYQYTPINIGDIIARIEDLEKNASIIDISDTITLSNIEDGSQFIDDSISLLVGESKIIKYSTLSTYLPGYISSNPNIVKVSKDNEKSTITITAASELTTDDDSIKIAKITLTSYDGLIGDKRYTSTNSSIFAYVTKKTQNISYGTGFNGNLTVKTPVSLNINGAYTELVATPSSTTILEVSVSGNTININPLNKGTAYITAYAKSSTTYKQSNPKIINVKVSEQAISPSKIKLTQSTLSLSGKNATATLTYTFEPSGVNTNTAVTFTSDNEKVATVNKTSGNVTPVNAGTTYISASTPNGINAKCQIIVNEGTVQSVTVTPSSYIFNASGGYAYLTANIEHDCFSVPTISWVANGSGTVTPSSGRRVRYDSVTNNSTTEVIKATVTATATNSNNSSSESGDCDITVQKKTVEIKYYWYVGQTNPATMTSISPIVSDTSSPGWRLIGNTKPTSSTFTSTNMLWNGDTNNISFGSRIISYIAIPYKPLQMWDVTGGDGLFYTIQNNGNTVNINGADYYVYMSDYKTAAFTMNIYNK